MYRIKTEEEFEKEYGINWRAVGFPSCMDSFLGKPISKESYDKVLDRDSFIDETPTYLISKNMVTVDSKKKPILSHIVTKKTYRIKTKKEFKNEFGENWRKLSFNVPAFTKEMDRFLGMKMSKESFDRIMNEESLIKEFYPYCIGKHMVTIEDVKKQSLVGSGLSIPGISSPALAALNGTDVAFIDSGNRDLRKYRFDGSNWSVNNIKLSDKLFKKQTIILNQNN